MLHNDEPCRLCNNVVNPALRAREDTILLNNNDFVCVPVLGALLVGYVMIVSVRHIETLVIATDSEMDSLVEILGMLLKRSPYCDGYLIFEHGSTQCQSTTSCIEHFHLHIVPVKNCSTREVIKRLNLNGDILELNSVLDLRNLTKSGGYIFVSDGQSSSCIFSDNVPSQLVRRIIAQMIGLEEEWNWAIYDHQDNILKTLELFNLNQE